MNYKLIALDMDDTLLTTEKTISAKNQETIKQALEQGIKVVLCSGRTHNAITGYAKTLGISGENQYMITNGGGMIENMAGKVIFSRTMSNQFYREFVDFIKRNQLHYNVVDDKGNTYTSHVEKLDKYTITQAFENDNGLYIREPEELPDDFEIVKAIINGPEQQLDEISEMVHQHFDQDYFVVRTGVGFLEIFPQDVNKGEAVKQLAAQLKIDLSQVMAMGDRDNDISMLKVAGKGVAMENATSGAKAVSDYVTADNNHDGVGLAIEKFAL
ncbi:Cof-type HAD-IIB family hydrolase [Companilactobacillus kimchii]|uniref:HAD superfamily hydrolase n=2 Tax=Companilactobacillus kimchii TaxID=2801452 RepID=A0ABR5NT78_9LACO|nr:Cof-type HAD-IIB family hydrolase [Companilactobacillus kimchii]KAE9561988.1 haloacid dehalogenase [Companilactobacillus kimchii]KRK51408.1 HAD superfamily hydrolase [Companilactobacillus kimchii DSM 13961 = JCM 10707]OWF34108.1 putative phosphatase YcsE [Companilactobacillus kimchii]GEO46022.1 hydrolase [Companilactobacillus paralimentarius]